MLRSMPKTLVFMFCYITRGIWSSKGGEAKSSRDGPSKHWITSYYSLQNREMLDSESEVCAYKGPYISLATQTGAIQLLMKTGDPSGQRTQELEASKEQSDCSYLVQMYDSQKGVHKSDENIAYVFTNFSASPASVLQSPTLISVLSTLLGRSCDRPSRHRVFLVSLCL